MKKVAAKEKCGYLARKGATEFQNLIKIVLRDCDILYYR